MGELGLADICAGVAQGFHGDRVPTVPAFVGAGSCPTTPCDGWTSRSGRLGFDGELKRVAADELDRRPVQPDLVAGLELNG